MAGLSLMQMSLAWTLEHPGVTSVLLGARTGEQLVQLLSAEGVVLGEDVLDAIDTVVQPGDYVDPRNAGWVSPALAKECRRTPRG
jgi:aryl-alcohol dehydrogenase-like predicted oxidoreductase